MGRGPLSEETRRARALALAEQFLGRTVEQPLEDTNDLMREAQSVINYFEANGGGFKHRECKTCGLTFAYCWNVDSISYCSVSCMDKALRNIGLKWDPTKSPSDRWGQCIPAIVPPSALKISEHLLTDDTPEDPLDSILLELD